MLRVSARLRTTTLSLALATLVSAGGPAATAAVTDAQTVHQASARKAARTTLVSADFESVPRGRMSSSSFSREIGGSGSSSTFEDSFVVDTGRRAGKILRVRLEKGTIRGKPAGNHGVVAFAALPREVDNACIRYRIRFSKRFDFSLGGKLPGLEGVAPGVHPSVPAGGGSPGSKGWSGRMMWLGPEAYSWAGPVNKAVSYMYGPRQTSQYGDNVRWNVGFKRARWHRVKQCYRMNSVGRANGVLRGWLDGRRVLDVRNHVYRTRSDVRISHVMWSVFRGGATMDWAGARDGHVSFDNVRVTTRG